MQLLNKLTDSNAQKKNQNAFNSEDLCHDFKFSRQEQLSKYKEMKQQYRTVCFRVTELIGKNKKQSAIKSNDPAHSTTVTSLLIPCPCD